MEGLCSILVVRPVTGVPIGSTGFSAQEVSDVVGIDINDATIEALKSEGYDARLGDARDFDLTGSSTWSSRVNSLSTSTMFEGSSEASVDI